MKEYRILQQYNNACPYSIGTYLTFEQAKRALEIMTEEFSYKSFKRKNYYIDNDFYDNEFLLGLPYQCYYQIQERDVGEWHKYSSNLRNKNPDKNNIFYLF